MGGGYCLGGGCWAGTAVPGAAERAGPLCTALCGWDKVRKRGLMRDHGNAVDTAGCGIQAALELAGVRGLYVAR